jgi:hypothetical protein
MNNRHPKPDHRPIAPIDIVRWLLIRLHQYEPISDQAKPGFSPHTAQNLITRDLRHRPRSTRVLIDSRHLLGIQRVAQLGPALARFMLRMD